MSRTSDERWLCLRLTHLGLNSAGIGLNSDRPAAITDQQQLWQCNKRAQQAGINAGMSVNHALMLEPELNLLERDVLAETEKLQNLSIWAYRFTSLVSLYNDHCLLLEIGRSIKLFNGLDHILYLINSDLERFQVAADCGLALTPKAAHLLSHCEQTAPYKAPSDYQAQLLQCPLNALDIDARAIAQLHNCGFELLADIIAIPVAELGQRFGRPLLDYLQQLNGDRADPQIAVTPPETFHSSVDFAEPISNLQWIEQQLERLLQDLHNFITQRQLVCRSFTWRFYHANNRLLHTTSVGLSSAQNTLETLRQLTDLKLASAKLSWEFSSIELSSTQLVPAQLFINDLFDPQPDQQKFKQLLDKLINRLGDQALFRLQIEAEHLPELSNGRQPAAQERVQEVGGSYYQPRPTLSKASQDQPLWLLETPQRLPQHQQHPIHEGPLNLLHGPDRISSHWWAKLQSRDYFIARQRNGRLLWIFFDRNSRQWFLHGLFA